MNNEKISKGILLGVRIAALLLIVIFFLPSVCVSCQGEEMNLSAFNAATGLFDDKDELSTDISPSIEYFFIPIFAILIIVFAKNKKDWTPVFCSAANIILMILMKSEVKKIATKEAGSYIKYVRIETTAAYFFHMLLCVSIIIALLVDKFIICHPENRIKFEAIIKNLLGKAPNAENQSVICLSCGSKNPNTAGFCSSCGTALPQDVALSNAQTNPPSVTEPKVDPERINKIEKLYADGLITKEEYEKALINAHKEV